MFLNGENITVVSVPAPVIEQIAGDDLESRSPDLYFFYMTDRLRQPATNPTPQTDRTLESRIPGLGSLQPPAGAIAVPESISVIPTMVYGLLGFHVYGQKALIRALFALKHLKNMQKQAISAHPQNHPQTKPKLPKPLLIQYLPSPPSRNAFS